MTTLAAPAKPRKSILPKTRPAALPVLTPVGVKDVSITGGFLKTRIDTNRASTLPLQYRKNQESGALDGFQWEWWDKSKGLPPFKFWCGDVAKWIEAASYSQMTHFDADLETLIEDAIERILNGQKDDGYLYSNPLPKESRWGNLQEYHELYDLGHLIEAAVAHHAATGKRHFLDAICRSADLACETFGDKPGQIRGACGHPEVELALAKLYRATGARRYLDLAKFFVDVRGAQPLIYEQELPKLQDRGLMHFGWYAPQHGGYANCQAHMPFRQQRDAAGHAVRALYLYCGAADVAALTGDRDLRDVCRALWQSVVQRRMYVIGGVGSSAHGERFTYDHDLPNEDGYAETCANIGLFLFAHRMLNMECDGQYADVMERALYNGILSGVSRDGDRYFYANHLAVCPHHANGTGGAAHGHVATTRQQWFGCACCPPNISRLLSSLGGYFYGSTPGALFVHLYGDSQCAVRIHDVDVKLTQSTDYPWKEKIAIRVDPAMPVRFALKLRLPGWLRPGAAKITRNGKAVAYKLSKGYASIEALWQLGDRVELTLPMPVEQIESHPAVRMNCGQVALQRGPVVYCVEEIDNGRNLADISIAPTAAFMMRPENSLGGAVSISTTAQRRAAKQWTSTLYRAQRSARKNVRIKAVPYCLWNNRGDGEMRVWLQRR